MKASTDFKNSIKAHLDKRAAEDELFAVTYKKENKSLDECCNYVMKCAQDGKCAGYSDAEVFGWAVHYYDEDDLKDIKPVSGKVVVNHSVELSEQDKEEVKTKAMQQLTDEELKKAKLKHKVTLSDADKVEVKQRAMDQAILEAKEQMTARKKPKTVKATAGDSEEKKDDQIQPSLF